MVRNVMKDANDKEERKKELMNKCQEIDWLIDLSTGDSMDCLNSKVNHSNTWFEDVTAQYERFVLRQH